MRALYRCGRQAEALQVYQDTRRLLVGELGIEPSQALQRLEQAILRQEPSLEPPVQVAPTANDRCVVASRSQASPRCSPQPPCWQPFWRREQNRRLPSTSSATRSRSSIRASNRVDRQIPVGARPAFVAYGEHALWVANLDDNSISRVDPRTSRVVRTIATDASPAGVAVGAGSVWVANSDAATVSRIDPHYNRSVQTIPIRGPIAGSA